MKWGMGYTTNKELRELNSYEKVINIWWYGEVMLRTQCYLMHTGLCLSLTTVQFLASLCSFIKEYIIQYISFTTYTLSYT
jgi:hypothetical protein